MSIELITACVLAYLMGSIPFGLILTKLAGLGDIRKVGSGNIGATNVLRMGNKKLAAAVLLLDGAKGWLAVWVAIQLNKAWLMTEVTDPAASSQAGFPTQYVYAAALAVIIGHVFPVWLKFKGGKGVATALGTILAIAPALFLIAILGWLTVFKITRYSSFSALGAFVLVALMSLAVRFSDYFMQQYLPTYMLAITVLIFWTHRANIRRLMRGEEPKFGKKKEG